MQTAPLNLPADVAGLLATFRLTLADVLTETNPKLAKTTAAHSVIHHALPHRALARAIDPANADPVAPRAYVETLHRLAIETGTVDAARRHNGCTHATAGCAAACLNGAGHGGLSVSVTGARGRRTLAMIADPVTYGRAMLYALARQLQRARRDGLPLAYRLCGTDETPWFARSFPVSVADHETIRRRFGVWVAVGETQTIHTALSVPNAD
ncbi:MAG: GP88 family protein, partial [Burkholderiaceae bacterium]